MIPPFRREFDAARDPATARNTLGLIDPGVWTPVLTFATPGDLSVAYAAQRGRVARIGAVEIVWFEIQTSSFTHTTASGNLRLTGLTRASNSVINFTGYMEHYRGITKATYTSFGPRLNTSSTIEFIASGSGVAPATVAATDTPTGGTINLRGAIIFFD